MNNFEDLFVSSETTIEHAIRKMDEVAKKILLIVEGRKLLGVITDGDIRRWILQNGKLEEAVGKIANFSPKYVFEKDYTKEEAGRLMSEHKIEGLPLVNEKKEVTSMVFWYDIFDRDVSYYNQINTPVVIMAGGQGTRLRPYTKVLPKPLIPIGDKPILELLMERFRKFGCRNFYLSINYKANMIKAYFSDLERDYNIHYLQEDKPLGTAGSLHLLSGKLNESFFVNNCDILVDADYSDILEFHRKNKNKITIIASLKHYVIPYGVVEIGNNEDLKRIMEKPEYNFLVNTGMYLFEPEIIKSISADQFLQIPDLINNYLGKKEKVGIYPVSEKSWMDMGQLEELQAMMDQIGVK